MVHMLLLPFLPITALIVQNSGVLIKQLQYQREVTEIGRKVDEIKILEKFITNLQSERAEVAFYIFTNGSQTLEMNLTTRYKIMIGAWKGSDKVIASVKICNMGGTYLSLHLSEMALPFHGSVSN